MDGSRVTHLPILAARHTFPAVALGKVTVSRMHLLKIFPVDLVDILFLIFHARAALNEARGGLRLHVEENRQIRHGQAEFHEFQIPEPDDEIILLALIGNLHVLMHGI